MCIRCTCCCFSCFFFVYKSTNGYVHGTLTVRLDKHLVVKLLLFFNRVILHCGWFSWLIFKINKKNCGLNQVKCKINEGGLLELCVESRRHHNYFIADSWYLKPTDFPMCSLNLWAQQTHESYLESINANYIHKHQSVYSAGNHNARLCSILWTFDSSNDTDNVACMQHTWIHMHSVRTMYHMLTVNSGKYWQRYCVSIASNQKVLIFIFGWIR